MLGGGRELVAALVDVASDDGELDLVHAIGSAVEQDVRNLVGRAGDRAAADVPVGPADVNRWRDVADREVLGIAVLRVEQAAELSTRSADAGPWGSQPSPNRAARRSAGGDDPAIKIGGRG